MKGLLTYTQRELLAKVREVVGMDKDMPYDCIKAMCGFKSFDLSFNALLEKGYVERVSSDDFSNRFKLTNK